jgi:hypothetical protein
MTEKPWREYYEQLTDAEINDLTAGGALELANGMMAEEDEEFADLEAELGLPRGHWVPAAEYRFIPESQDMLDVREERIEAEYARQEAALQAMDRELETLRQKERKAKWKPFV